MYDVNWYFFFFFHYQAQKYLNYTHCNVYTVLLFNNVCVLTWLSFNWFNFKGRGMLRCVLVYDVIDYCVLIKCWTETIHINYWLGFRALGRFYTIITIFFCFFLLIRTITIREVQYHRIDRKKKPGNNSFIVWFSDELIKTYRIKWYQAKILVRSQSRHFSLDTLFQVIIEKTKCYIVLPSHVQMNMFYFV